MKDAELYVAAEGFHQDKAPIYNGELGWAVNKKAAQMAKVHYQAPNFNAAEDGLKQGSGDEYATWVFSEEHAQAEGLFQSGLELMMDVQLEPAANIGLHWHDYTEEVFYVLKGSLTVTTVTRDGEEHSENLKVGDAHMVRLGQGHYAVAGRYGARFIAVATRKS